MADRALRVVEHGFRVERPPEIVFDYLTNPSNLVRWQSGLESVEQLTDGEVGPGTRIAQRGRSLGAPVVQVTEITELDRPRRFSADVVEGPVLPSTITYTFESDGEGTLVRLRSQYAMVGIRRRILAPILHPLIARALATEHRKLARILEAG